MINLPKYLKIEILNNLELCDLLNMRLVNKLLNEFIKDNKWVHIMIKCKNEKWNMKNEKMKKCKKWKKNKKKKGWKTER